MDRGHLEDIYEMQLEQKQKQDMMNAKKIMWALIDLVAIFFAAGTIGVLFMTQSEQAFTFLGFLMFASAYVAGTLREKWRWENEQELKNQAMKDSDE